MLGNGGAIMSTAKTRSPVRAIRYKPSTRGFSLVELMISLSLGLFLSLSVIQTYLTTLKSDRVIFASTEIQENARFALQVLEKGLQQAGYFSDITNDRERYFKSNNSQWQSTVFTNNNALQGFDDSESPIENQPASVEGTDQVFLRFMSDQLVSGEGAPWYDCNGVTIPENTAIQLGFYISTDSRSLMCMSELPGNADGTPADHQPLISNVTGFQLLYGVDSSNDGAINQYVDAQDVIAAGGWDNVKTIKVSLELAASATTAIEPKLFEKVIALRNM